MNPKKFPTSLLVAGVVFTLAHSLQAGDLEFRLHTVNTNSLYSASSAMDVNKDGHIDIVSGGFWHEGPAFTESHLVREVEMMGFPPRADGYSHLEFDVNSDGWTDLVHVNWRSRSIYWNEHPGESLGEWQKHVVEEPGNMETGRLYDIDGDGQVDDVLPNGSGFAAWWEIIPGSEPQWIRHDLPRQVAGHGIGFGDLNGDGRGDVIGPNGWLEGPENPREMEAWTWHPDFQLGGTSVPIIVADVDEDGDNDMIWSLGHDYGTYWMENKDGEGADGWEKHTIDESWSQGHSPLWVDLDNNGVMDYVNGKRYLAHEGRDDGATDPLVIFRYEFNKETREWTRYDIQTNGPAGIGLDPKAADLDADGDLDLVLPGRSGLYWYENLLIEK